MGFSDELAATVAKPNSASTEGLKFPIFRFDSSSFESIVVDISNASSIQQRKLWIMVHLEPCQSWTPDIGIWRYWHHESSISKLRYMTMLASWIFDIEALYRVRYLFFISKNIFRYQIQKYSILKHPAMENGRYLVYVNPPSGPRYRRIFDVKCIFFDIRLLQYRRFFDIGIQNIYQLCNRYWSFVLRYRRCFDIDPCWPGSCRVAAIAGRSSVTLVLSSDCSDIFSPTGGSPAQAQAGGGGVGACQHHWGCGRRWIRTRGARRSRCSPCDEDTV